VPHLRKARFAPFPPFPRGPWHPAQRPPYSFLPAARRRRRGRSDVRSLCPRPQLLVVSGLWGRDGSDRATVTGADVYPSAADLRGGGMNTFRVTPKLGVLGCGRYSCVRRPHVATCLTCPYPFHPIRRPSHSHPSLLSSPEPVLRRPPFRTKTAVGRIQFP